MRLNLSTRRSCVLLDAVNQPIARTSTTDSDTSAPIVAPSPTASGRGPTPSRLGLPAIRIAAVGPSAGSIFVGDIAAPSSRSATPAGDPKIPLGHTGTR